MKKSVLMILLWLASAAAGFCQNDLAPPAPDPTSLPKDPASQSDWHITWAPDYLWLSAVNGNLGVSGKTIPIDASFSDVFDKLNIGYMTAADVRKGRLGVLTDFQFVDLSSDEISTPFGRLYTSARTDSQMYILDPEIYGRVVDNPKGSVDALVGIRYWHLRNTLDLRPGDLRSDSNSVQIFACTRRGFIFLRESQQ